MMKLWFILFSIFVFSTLSIAQVKWMSWEEAIEAQKKEPRKIMVDIYTVWCGPCKMMDRNTFSNPVVAKILNENFYPVKLDAEGKKDITYNNHTFTWQPGGRNGIHTLAYSLSDGKLSFPTMIFLDESVSIISRVPGYHNPEDFIPILNFHAKEFYKRTSWEVYSQGLKSGN